MQVIQIDLAHRAKFMELLLIGDEQENMVTKYLYHGDMFALYENGLKAVCIVIPINAREYEIKNIAVVPKFQRKGYGKRLIYYLLSHYKGRCNALYVGTGDSPLTIPFYESCGFIYSHTVKNFFTDHYDHPIWEGGKQLIDMIYLKRYI